MTIADVPFDLDINKSTTHVVGFKCMTYINVKAQCRSAARAEKIADELRRIHPRIYAGMTVYTIS